MICVRSTLIALFIVTPQVYGEAPAPTAAPGMLVASLLPDSVAFSGVTKGSDLVLFGASIRSELGTQTRVQYTELLSDGDGDGNVVFQPKGGVPFRSVWTGVDVSTGSVAVTAPQGYELDHADLSLDAVKHDAEGLPIALEIERFRVYMLLVRPGAGVWLYVGAQGGPNDGDRSSSNGRLTALFGDAEAISGKYEKAPKHLKRGDVIAVLDPGHMDLRTWTVAK